MPGYTDFHSSNGRSRYPRILVVLPNWVGDVVLATPALRALREHFSDAHITYLLRPYVADLVASSPWVDELLFWPSRSPRHFFRYRQRDSLRLIATLRQGNYSLAILMTNSFRSGLVAASAGVQTRLGYDREGRGVFLTDRLVPPRLAGRFLPISMVEYYNALAAYVGCTPTSQLELSVDPDNDAALVKRLTRSEPALKGPRVVLNPGASFGSAKCWIPERFAEVGRTLVDRYGARLLISCSPSERHVAREISRQIPHPHVLLDDPVLPLGQLVALIRRSELLITNDTGPRHFAVACGVPVVAIFGPTDPRWTETGYSGERKVFVPVECGPCMLRTCPIDHRCMKLVTAEMVIEAATSLCGLDDSPVKHAVVTNATHH